MPNPLYLRPGSRQLWPVIRPVGDRKHGQSISINRQTCVIGARSRVHLPLESALISRTHAVIINDRDETYIRDLASTNRIYLNGSPIREARLNKADLLRIGPFTFFCHSGFPAAADLLEADAGGPTERASIVVEGANRRVPIHGRTLLIGQREGCDVRIDKPLVSRTHAIIYSREGKRFLRDLNSTAGTFLNDRKVREAELRTGDMIRVGVSVLRFEFECVEPQYDEGTQLRLMDRDDAEAAMSGTGLSVSRIFSASASFGGGTVGAASLGGITMPGSFDQPNRRASRSGEMEASAMDFGFSSGVVLPPGERAETLVAHTKLAAANAPATRVAGRTRENVSASASNLRGLLDKFAPALAAAETETMPSPRSAEVPPAESFGEVVIPSFDSRSSMSGRSGAGRGRPVDLRTIEVATVDDLFAGPARAPGVESAQNHASVEDLLDDEFLRKSL